MAILPPFASFNPGTLNWLKRCTQNASQPSLDVLPELHFSHHLGTQLAVGLQGLPQPLLEKKNATRLFATKKTQGNTCPKTRTVAKESPRADLDLKWGRFSAPGHPEMFTLQLSSCAARRWDGDWDRQRIIGGSFKGDDHRICGTHLRNVGGSQHVTGRLAYIRHC